MKTIIYCRVSNLKENSFSFFSQEEVCVNYCKKNKLRIHEIHKEHKSGIGKQVNLVNIIKTNRNINLVIYNATRFSRNFTFGKNLLISCIDKNINVHFVKERLILNKYSEPDIINKILLGLKYSENEWNLIRDRNILNIKSRRELGLCIGGLPFGFDKDENKYLVKNNNYNVIEFIIQLRVGIKTVEEIRETLKNISNEYNLLQFYDENDNPINKFAHEYTLNFKEIADILNDFNICNRHWIPSRVEFLYNKYKDENIKELIEDLINFN